MRRVAFVTVAVALALSGIFAWLSGLAELAAYEAVIGTVGLVALIALGTPVQTQRRASRTASPRLVPPQLHRIERIVRFATSTAVDADRRLYPMLRDQARELLLGRRGVLFDTEPERAKRLLGDAAWEWIRPDRPVSVDRMAPGVDPEDIEVVVQSIEHLVDR
ncbi:MAG: hypothetical protein WAM81_12205 [Acidimicrobiia bacterium]